MPLRLFQCFISEKTSWISIKFGVSSPSIIRTIKENEMDRTCSTNGKKMYAYRILMGTPEGKRLLGKQNVGG
jgi:hypothetical protein